MAFTIITGTVLVIYLITRYGTWKRLMHEYSYCKRSDSPIAADALNQLNAIEGIAVLLLVAFIAAFTIEAFHIF